MELEQIDKGIKQAENKSRIQFLTNELHKLGVYHIKPPNENEHVQLSIEDYTNTIHDQAAKGLEKYGQAMDREQMIFQLMVYTRYTEKALERLTDAKLKEMYKVKVEGDV